MPRSRYCIHAIYAHNDQPLITSQLAIFLEDKAFITHDLPLVTQQTTAYSRRCIDNADMVIMIIGEAYGQTNLSGVSQLHLSYLTAKTKNKPLLILIKSMNEEARTRHLQGLITIIEADDGANIHYYRDHVSFTEELSQGYETLSENLNANGWLKSKKLTLADSISPMPTHIHVQNMTNQSLNRDNTGQALASNLGISEQVANQRVSSNHMHNPLSDKNTVMGSSATNRVAQQTRLPKKPKRTTQEAYIITDSFGNPLDDNISPQHSSPTGTSSQILNKRSSNAGTATDPKHTADMMAMSLDDIVEITYDAHAYQDGNLKDVVMSTPLSWRNVLQLLAKLGGRFAIESVERSLNREIAKTATIDVAATMPDVHAVSRCEIRKKDFDLLLQQLQNKGWIEIVPQASVGTREFWQLTDAAKAQLREAQDLYL